MTKRGDIVSTSGVLCSKFNPGLIVDTTEAGIPIVPREFGGMWVAWNREGTAIVAAADDLEEAEQSAREAGESRPRLEKVPRSEIRMIGGAKR